MKQQIIYQFYVKTLRYIQTTKIITNYNTLSTDLVLYLQNHINCRFVVLENYLFGTILYINMESGNIRKQKLQYSLYTKVYGLPL